MPCYTWMWLMWLIFCEDLGPLHNYLRQCFHLDSDVDVDPIIGKYMHHPCNVFRFSSSLNPTLCNMPVSGLSNGHTCPNTTTFIFSETSDWLNWLFFLTPCRSLTWLMQIKSHVTSSQLRTGTLLSKSAKTWIPLNHLPNPFSVLSEYAFT